MLAKEGEKVRLIRFGQQGVTGAGDQPRTKAQKARRASFKARHAENIAKGSANRPASRPPQPVGKAAA